jgi:dolichol-phosphate mannosyltransferase
LVKRRKALVFVSVVVPVLNEENNIEALAEAIRKVLSRYEEWEILFIDDGSTDKSLENIRKLAAKNGRIGFVSFTRNFGHQAALRAGLEKTSGDCVITMDGDFQHPPELIPHLIDEFEKGVDIVSTKRLDTSSPTGLGKRLTSRFFYSLLNSLGGIHIEPGSADFRLFSAKARSTILAMHEHNLFIRGAVVWTGLPSATVEYVPAKRRSGHTKYSFGKMSAFALEGLTSFSVRPLRVTSIAGTVISLLGFLYALYALAIRIFTDKAIGGWASLLISVLIIGGIQLLSIGILGEYLGKLFLESKGRPEYIVREESTPKTPEKETP